MALRDKVFYHPDTGILLWRVNDRGIRYGTVAGYGNAKKKQKKQL